ncbi:conserved hypothetical protein [Novosphingobium sp. KN65.2]|nr:conserved hypothetical protein [Novosphingobium sp. KN65.2]
MSFPAHVIREKGGNVLPLAAVGMLVAAAVVGSGIDLSRAYKVENRLQSACDAGVLAGRRTVTTNGFDAASQSAAKAFFTANFDDSRQETRSTDFKVTADEKANTVTGTATTVLDTLIMRLFGYNDFTLSVTCGSSMGVGNADIMMVLDTTGSMNNSLSYSQTRIMALRDAMKNFYDTLANATSGTNARIRYGFVPYSSSVNVGRLLYDEDPSYIADARTYQSRQAYFIDYSTATKTSGTPTYKNESSTYWDKYSNTGYNSSDCGNQVPGNDANYSDYGSATTTMTTSGSGSSSAVIKTTTQPQRKAAYQCDRQGWNGKYYIWVYYYTRDKVTSDTYTNYTLVNSPGANRDFYTWEYKPVSYSTSQYKAFSPVTTYTGENGAAVSSTWAGCIEERTTTASSSFSYSSSNGYSPSGAMDIDIDTAPTATESTKWSPLWPEVAYRRWNSSGYYTTSTSDRGGSASSYCPAKAQLLTEMSESAFDSYANSLAAQGSTYLDIGMIWGGRMLSPDGIFGNTVNIEPNNGGEVSRHIVFMTDGVMEPNYLIQQAWGIEYWDRRVTSDGYTDDTARHTSRFLAVCNAIKDKGIRIWVVAFTSGLSTDLKTCASDNSSFTANSSAELNTAFQEIAKQVGELRITQ